MMFSKSETSDMKENTDTKENIDTKEHTDIIYVDPKHEKYFVRYKPNSLYWGIGIENEVYLEFEKKHEIKKQDLITKRKRC